MRITRRDIIGRLLWALGKRKRLVLSRWTPNLESSFVVRRLAVEPSMLNSRPRWNGQEFVVQQAREKALRQNIVRTGGNQNLGGFQTTTATTVFSLSMFIKPAANEQTSSWICLQKYALAVGIAR